MKKKILSALLATLMLATMLSGCGGKKDDSTSSNGGNGSGTVSSRVWKFSHTRAEGTDNDIMANKFADSLMENLDGLQIDMYPNNQLGDYTVVQEAVGLDEVQLMLGSMSNGVDPTLSVQIAPYLVNNWDDAYEFYNSDDGIITNYVRESLEKQNIHLLAVMPKYFGAIMTTKPASKVSYRCKVSKMTRDTVFTYGWTWTACQESMALAAVRRRRSARRKKGPVRIGFTGSSMA